MSYIEQSSIIVSRVEGKAQDLKTKKVIKMEILVNGQVKELNIIDAKSGMEWTADLLGNHNALGYDDEKEMPTMSEDNFNWWSDLLPRYENADQEVFDYVSELDESDSFYEILNSLTACDLEDMPALMLAAIEEHKELKK